LLWILTRNDADLRTQDAGNTELEQGKGRKTVAGGMAGLRRKPGNPKTKNRNGGQSPLQARLNGPRTRV
jgi:hypothetical protein